MSTNSIVRFAAVGALLLTAACGKTAPTSQAESLSGSSRLMDLSAGSIVHFKQGIDLLPNSVSSSLLEVKGQGKLILDYDASNSDRFIAPDVAFTVESASFFGLTLKSAGGFLLEVRSIYDYTGGGVFLVSDVSSVLDIQFAPTVNIK